MPRPTFIQAVLRKPARSYADPDAPLPWSDSYHDPRYPAPADDCPPAYPLYPHDARPSRRISRPASAASDTSRTRFPKPSRKATHHVLLRDGEIIHAPVAGSLSAAPSVRSTRRTEKLTKPANVPAKTTKKKRKPKPVTDRSDSSISPPASAGSFSTPPGLHSRFSETSSASSSALIPISPVAPTLAPRVTQGARPLPAKAPASRQSTPSSSSQSVTRPASIPPKIIETETVEQHVQQGSDSEDEVFYTPRSSFSFSFNATTLPEELPDPIETPKAVEMAEPMLDPVVTPKQKTDILLGAPVFNLLPPTPAPMPDPISTPFHSQPASPIDRSSLHPDHLPHTTSRPSLARRVIIPSRNMVGKPPPLPPKDDDDMESASGQAGSDDEESRRGGGGGDYSCTPKSSSRPCSRAQSIRSSSRRSHHTPHNSLKDIDTSRPTSEASFGSGGGGVSRGSSVVAGFGKGGWAAAAAASTGSRSGATTPVMYLPANGTTGWEGFQPANAGASAPRRHSKFTPLPAASLPSFDRLVNSPSLADGSIHSPSNTPVPVPVSYSSPSEYSQASVSDNLPMPSRSYTAKNYSSETSQSSSSRSRFSEAEADGQEDSRQTWNTMGSQPLKAPVYPPRTPSPLPPSSSSPCRLSQYSRPTSPSLPLESTWRPSPSQPQPQSQPQSPIPTRPTTPRAGFEPPSFLDPDILTILPEMTPQDSERLYRPSSPPPERSRSRLSVYHDNGGQLSHSTRSSVFRGSKSEVGHGQAQGQGYEHEHGSEAGEEDDGLAELPLPSMIKRSKSAAGYRFGGGSKWEGSSYGDGVLMESHGRDQESAPGYTNLILPLGAYKQSNPAKSAPDLDARILGLPHASMASITLHSTFDHHNATPAHLRDQLPPLVEFSSHSKPPGKTGKNQVLVQVYAVAVDQVDVRAVDEKGRGDVGKYVPGRSFVGRALVVGTDEKEVVRGDVVMGLLDIRKSGALAEYILVDRRRVSRAPFPTLLTLEQLSILPLQGIAAARCVRGSLNRQFRAIVINAHTGIAALVCQVMSRAGVYVTAIIPGGDDSHEAHQKCIENGAKGVLMGSPAAVMINLEENGYDFVFDTQGGQRVYDTARRALKSGGKLVSTKRPEATLNRVPPHLASRPSGIKTLRTVFGSKRKDSKFISFEYVSPIGSGEPEIDASGMDCRDVMEEPCMATFRPVLEGESAVVPFERGAEVFKRQGWDECGVRVVRIIN
ncbi:hypothetical protein C359_03196 [Cryptococcus neoformans Bt120]|nr:hypothetical protein C359_03196 [Cryptococcus neoformans var. grubii Bt120]